MGATSEARDAYTDEDEAPATPDEEEYTTEENEDSKGIVEELDEGRDELADGTDDEDEDNPGYGTSCAEEEE